MLDYAEINGKEIDAQVLRTLGCGIDCAREAVKDWFGKLWQKIDEKTADKKRQLTVLELA